MFDPWNDKSQYAPAPSNLRSFVFPSHRSSTQIEPVSLINYTSSKKLHTSQIIEDKVSLESIISARFAKTDRIRDIFGRPEEDSDRLYRPEYCHIEPCDCLSE